MIGTQQIQALSERIAHEFQPERIILFGSYAYGTPREDSDVDLLVILPFRGSSLQKAVEILRRVQPPFAVDIVARTPEEVRQRLEWNDFFLREIMARGKVLHAAADR
jgi:predicted nucleotidyltransferase